MEFFFSSRRRHTRYWRDWSSDVCSSDLEQEEAGAVVVGRRSYEEFAPVWGTMEEFATYNALPHYVVSTTLEHDDERDRKSVVEGKSVDLGGRRIIKKKQRESVYIT